MTEIPETTANPEENAPAVKLVPAKKPRVGAQTRHVAPSKGKRGRSADSARKPNRGPKAAKSANRAIRARDGSKTAKFISLLKRSGGATGKDLMKATGWQAHSVRGFISGVLARKMGLTVTSSVENGARRYSLKG